ncbi:hypothetical protein AB7280_02920 [Providencia rettgeri]
MYNTGTVTTTANSTKVTGTNTKWKDNNSLVSAEQVILIQNGTTVYINSIASIQSDTELTLSFAAPAAVKNGSYRILTTMVNSISDAANKLVAMNNANAVFSEVLNRMFTETGIITVVLPDGTTLKTKTFAEMDKQLDGKLDKAGGTISGDVTFSKNAVKSTNGTHTLPKESGTLMQVGDYGVGFPTNSVDIRTLRYNGFFTSPGFSEQDPGKVYFGVSSFNAAKTHGVILAARVKALRLSIIENDVESQYDVYHTGNTAKDSNGNLKVASPIVKVFADHIETNDESEGATMEYLGVGHYLVKGVLGFNADGAWGINNGIVIPQDYNGKNLVLVDYDVKKDGSIEMFVFHQQSAEMPERFQNKRIKHFDEEGVPVYFENYEPCDVPESRWIDMRVEMPPNSLYNQKQAEAERLAKIEAERLAQEEAKRAAEEAERVEQEAEERKQYGLDENSVLL